MTRAERIARAEELRQWIRDQNEEFRDEGFPADVQSQWDLNNTELREHERVLAELEARDARIAEVAERSESNRELGADTGARPARRGTPALIRSMSEAEVYDLRDVRHSPFAPERSAGEVRERALRAVELSHFPAAGRDQESAREHVAALVRRADSDDYSAGEVARRILSTGAPAYKRAFAKMLSASLRGMPGAVNLSAEEMRAVDSVRALSVGTGSAGGFAVPYQLDPTIIPTSNLSVNPFRAIAGVEQISGTNEWRGLTSAGVTAGYAAEATEASDNSPTFVQPTLTTVRAQCFVPVSIELTQDWGAIEAGLGTLIQDAKDDLEATKFLSGTGTNEPFGLLTGATTTVTSASVATFAVADLYSTENALGPRFRPRAQWVGNRGTYNRVRQFDTAGGANLWVYLAAGLANNVPRGGNTGAELLGYSANELSTMVSTVTTASKILVFGDFRYYKIVDRIGMDVEIIPHLFGAANRFPTGQRGFYAFWRNTAKVLDANAFRVLTIQ
jgi:HK97 family phage major capsid protein